jgi:hypothetical protein
MFYYAILILIDYYPYLLINNAVENKMKHFFKFSVNYMRIK